MQFQLFLNQKLTKNLDADAVKKFLWIRKLRFPTTINHTMTKPSNPKHNKKPNAFDEQRSSAASEAYRASSHIIYRISIKRNLI